MNTIKITSLDSVTVNGEYVGSITNAVANKKGNPNELHDALAAFHAAQVAVATQTGTDAANAAVEPAHTRLAALLASGTPADIATAKTVLAQAMLPAKQKKIAVAQAKLAKAQADLAAAQSA